MIRAIFKRFDESEELELRSCPFCGTLPKVEHIGNDYTKKRTIKVKCPECRCQQTNSALRNGFAWLEDVAVELWNNRDLPEGGDD